MTRARGLGSLRPGSNSEPRARVARSQTPLHAQLLTNAVRGLSAHSEKSSCAFVAVKYRVVRRHVTVVTKPNRLHVPLSAETKTKNMCRTNEPHAEIREGRPSRRFRRNSCFVETKKLYSNFFTANDSY